MVTRVYLVVNAEERVVGLATTYEEADGMLAEGDSIVPLLHTEITDGNVPLFYLPRLGEFNPIDIQELAAEVEEHGWDLEEVFHRVGRMEIDVYGEEQKVIQVELELEDDDLN